MNCPKCNGSEMWDNRTNKRNPKGPDYKCKDKACGHAIWLDKKPAQKAPQANGEGKWTWASLSRTYERCLLLAAKHVTATAQKYKLPAPPESVIAAAATLFIAASRDGVREVVKPPPTRAEMDEVPEQLEDEDVSPLPF